MAPRPSPPRAQGWAIKPAMNAAPEAEARPQAISGPEPEGAPEARELPTSPPWEAPASVGEETSRSPHPGFDRLRALASQRGRGGADSRGAAHGKPGAKRHGQDRQAAGPGPRFPAPKPRPEREEAHFEIPGEARTATEGTGPVTEQAASASTPGPATEVRPSEAQAEVGAVIATPPAAETRPAERVSAEAGQASVIREEPEAAPAREPKRKAAARKTVATKKAMAAKKAVAAKKPAAAKKRAASGKKAAAKAAKKPAKVAKKAVKKPAKQARGTTAAKSPKGRAAKGAKPRATAKKAPARKRR